MIIYKDLISGDEMFTDSSKLKLIDGCLWEVECRLVTRNMGEVILDGANPSAEGEDAEFGADGDAVESGLDLVLNQRLIETGFEKGDFKNYLRSYTKALMDKWKENGMDAEKIAEAKGKITDAVKKVLPKFDQFQFFLGSSVNPEGMVALLEYREVGSGEVPIMLFFKHGLEEEKV